MQTPECGEEGRLVFDFVGELPVDLEFVKLCPKMAQQIVWTAIILKKYVMEQSKTFRSQLNLVH